MRSAIIKNTVHKALCIEAEYIIQLGEMERDILVTVF